MLDSFLVTNVALDSTMAWTCSGGFLRALRSRHTREVCLSPPQWQQQTLETLREEEEDFFLVDDPSSVEVEVGAFPVDLVSPWSKIRASSRALLLGAAGGDFGA